METITKIIGLACVGDGKVAGFIRVGNAGGGIAAGLVYEINHVIGAFFGEVFIMIVVYDDEAISPAVGVDEAVF